MNITECECGMPMVWTPGFPESGTYEWHLMHKKVHMATFDNIDWVTEGNLDACIEAAREMCDA